MSYTILHNPRCSKSRQALELLRDQDIEPTVRLYLEDPLSRTELESLAKKLSLPAIEFTRTKEPEFKQAGLSNDSAEENILKAIATYPRLLERPIVIKGENAVIGRPTENITTLL